MTWSNREKLAITLLALGDIPYEDAKLMTTDQIISLYQFDHRIPTALGGSSHVSNGCPMLIAAHRLKTAGRDIPTIAKSNRLRTKWAGHKERMRAK